MTIAFPDGSIRRGKSEMRMASVGASEIKQLNVRLPADLHELSRIAAIRQGETLARYVERLIREDLWKSSMPGIKK